MTAPLWIRFAKVLGTIFWGLAFVDCCHPLASFHLLGDPPDDCSYQQNNPWQHKHSKAPFELAERAKG